MHNGLLTEKISNNIQHKEKNTVLWLTQWHFICRQTYIQTIQTRKKEPCWKQRKKSNRSLQNSV